MKKYYIRKIVNSDSIEKCCELVLKDNKIYKINVMNEFSGSEKIYSYAVPGFIDIHNHGGNGFDIMDANSESFSEIARYHLRNGTTSFLGSTITAPLDALTDILNKGKVFIEDNQKRAFEGREASFLGFHLEGPWISETNSGAQNPVYMMAPDVQSIELINKYHDLIKMVTFSYHYGSSKAFLESLVNHGIIPACGHDATSDDDIVKAFSLGLNHITHIYSNTSSFKRIDGVKHLGTLELSLMTKGVTVEVIADERHITKHFWNFIRHNKSVDEIMLVSDSIRAAGFPENKKKIYDLGGLDIIVDDGVAWLADKSVFAGSIANMHRMFQIITEKWGVDLKDAVKLTSYNQAKKLKVEDLLGSINEGKNADLVLLNDKLEIEKIIKSGIEISS